MYVTLLVGQSLKGNVAPNLRQCGFCYATQETTKHALWSCPLAQQVWNKVLSLFLTINVGCLFSWGAAIWGVLHSSLMLYEADNIHEAIAVHNRRLISLSSFQQVIYCNFCLPTISSIGRYRMERSPKQGKHLQWREIMAFIC